MLIRATKVLAYLRWICTLSQDLTGSYFGMTVYQKASAILVWYTIETNILHVFSKKRQALKEIDLYLFSN